MKPLYHLIRFLLRPTLANWRTLRSSCVKRLPVGTFKDRKRSAV